MQWRCEKCMEERREHQPCSGGTRCKQSGAVACTTCRDAPSRPGLRHARPCHIRQCSMSVEAYIHLALEFIYGSASKAERGQRYRKSHGHRRESSQLLHFAWLVWKSLHRILLCRPADDRGEAMLIHGISQSRVGTWRIVTI